MVCIRLEKFDPKKMCTCVPLVKKLFRNNRLSGTHLPKKMCSRSVPDVFQFLSTRWSKPGHLGSDSGHCGRALRLGRTTFR